MKVYLSSTYLDLKDYRESVYRTLCNIEGVQVMEDYGVCDERTVNKCLNEVEKCDAYIGLFAWRYNPVINLEYLKAINTKKTTFIFLLDEKTKWPENLIDNPSENIIKLRKELENNHVVSYFKNKEDLSKKISAFIFNHIYKDKNVQGIPKEEYIRLSKEYCLTEYTIKNFFKIIDQKEVPKEDWEITLRQISKNHKELLLKLDKFNGTVDSKLINIIKNIRFEREIVKALLKNNDIKPLIMNYGTMVRITIRKVLEKSIDYSKLNIDLGIDIIEEIEQDVYILICNKIKFFNPEKSSLRHWIYLITVSKTQSKISSKKDVFSFYHKGKNVDSINFDSIYEDCQYSQDETRNILNSALNQLKSAKRVSVSLRVLEVEEEVINKYISLLEYQASQKNLKLASQKNLKVVPLKQSPFFKGNKRVSLISKSEFESLEQDPVIVKCKNIFKRRIECSLFSPSFVNKNETFFIQVYIHLTTEINEVIESAKNFDKKSEKKGKTILDNITQGDKLNFLLDLRGVYLNEPLQSLIWNEIKDSVIFEIKIPKNFFSKYLIGKVTIILDRNSIPIGHIRFKIEIAKYNLKKENEYSTAKWYNYIFISYSSKDRNEVIRRIQILDLLKYNYFQDIFYLKPGDKWEEKIYENIERSDAFFLFWSSAARQSEWVKKEIAHALRVKNGKDEEPPEILPVIIENPPPEPPQELKNLHFNDHFTYLF